VEAVEMMVKVAHEIERHQWRDGHYGSQVFSDRRHSNFSNREAVAHAALELVRDLQLEALIVPTSSGTTAHIMAAHRATAPMVGVCSSETVCRRLSLYWGVIPVYLESLEHHDWRDSCRRIETQCELAKPGHTVLIVSGFNADPKLNEPVIKIMNL